MAGEHVAKLIRSSNQVTRDWKLTLKIEKNSSPEDADNWKAKQLHKQIDKLFVNAEVKICIDNDILFADVGVPFRGCGTQLDEAAFQLVFANVWCELVKSLARTRSKVMCNASRYMSTTATKLGHNTEEELVMTTCRRLGDVIKQAVEMACNLKYDLQGPHHQEAVLQTTRNDVEQGVPELDGQSVGAIAEMDSVHVNRGLQRQDSAVGAAPAAESAATAQSRAAELRPERPAGPLRPVPSQEQRSHSLHTERQPTGDVPYDPEKAELHHRHTPHDFQPLTAQAAQPRRPRVCVDRNIYLAESGFCAAGSGLLMLKVVAVGKAITLAAATTNPVGMGACAGTMLLMGALKSVLYLHGLE
ncbi:hypothetical protein B0A48_13588 [Cryoendolithus antarcticus]|uniref:Uncharacterized protein n=1 Tax=Cryoendolithus antarcticus TaxID=1507870 RepID=A0A1V8SPH9_9PEZI|nr:hypothetical protein B0A48_13588 [Cryoendolithus antarcticus]